MLLQELSSPVLSPSLYAEDPLQFTPASIPRQNDTIGGPMFHNPAAITIPGADLLPAAITPAVPMHAVLPTTPRFVYINTSLTPMQTTPRFVYTNASVTAVQGQQG